MSIELVKSLFRKLDGKSEECPLKPFMKLALLSNTRCTGSKCAYTRDSVYDAFAAMSSCVGEGYVKNPCYRKWTI